MLKMKKRKQKEEEEVDEITSINSWSFQKYLVEKMACKGTATTDCVLPLDSLPMFALGS